MSQLETQRDELEEDGREIEEALRDMKDSKYTSVVYQNIPVNLLMYVQLLKRMN
jgi:hypothetical protein